MAIGLDLRTFPVFQRSAYKIFTPGEYHTTRHSRDDVLLLMLEGTLHFTEDGAPAAVHAGEYYIQRRGKYQTGHIPSTGAVYYYIHFLGEYCENYPSLPLRGRLSLIDAHARFARMDLLQSTGGTLLELSADFFSILAELKQEISMTEHKKLVQDLAARMREDLCRKWSLEEMAALSGYSVSHLIDIFRRETGQTPHTFLTGLRLQAAQLCLMDSDMPMSRIAEECGFGSYVNFYKAFVKANAATPESWRRDYRMQSGRGQENRK